MTILILILGFLPNIPEPVSQYLIDPVYLFFVEDWRIGPSFGPLYETPSISGIPVSLLDDPSLISLNGIGAEFKDFKLNFNPYFFRADTPVSLLFSERGNSNYTHLGMFFGTSPFREKRASISMDTRYLSPEYFPTKKKITQLSLEGSFSFLGKHTDGYFIATNREGVEEGRERFYFGFLRWGNDSTLTFSYEGKENPRFPIGETYGLKARFELGRLGFLASGELEFSDRAYIFLGDATLKYSVPLGGGNLKVLGRWNYDEKLGSSPSGEVEYRMSHVKLRISRYSKSVHFSWRTENYRWEKGEEVYFSIYPIEIAGIEFRYKKSENTVFIKEGIPGQLKGKTDLYEILPRVEGGVGIFRLLLEGRFGKISPDIGGYRRYKGIFKFGYKSYWF